ncbi:hypothetical protein H105_08950 [Trichophyton soudanense CBS 452.61]|uniref:Enoyl reductase (ER) domain-containing protein n=1 Tax=Trichophyton soudanense CBS 452.61 TaxID=1215331 RepID=A0A022XD60_TRISD|nr:hypothetical protein H105_08950 [Trichophyton soudanense CBS 452.61]EZG00793.1 hypothetical protein H106_08815 [Trichophyton rubrum CBS 735.88]
MRKWLAGPRQRTSSLASTSHQQAVGNIVNGRQGDEVNYHIHPTVLDGTLQILGAAAVNGYARKTKAWLPTSIDKISVNRCISDVVTSVSAKLSSNFSVIGDGRCTSGGMTVVESIGIRMSLADSAGAPELPDAHAASRCEWRPDIDFLHMNELIHAPAGRTDHLRLLEELGDICLLLSQRSFSESPRSPMLPHLSKYVAWVRAQSTSIVTRLPWTWTGLDNEAISARIEGIISRLADTAAAPVASIICQICTNMDSFLSGESFGNGFSDGMLIPVYEFIGQMDRTEFIQHLGHSKPNLRILEIGAGKGVSLHHFIVDELTRPDGEILCSKYNITSPGYVVKMTQEKLFPNMEFASFDISKDPFDQGFEEVGYDLIIAVNALHEAEDVIGSLANIKKLLRPDGRLFLQELCPSSKWVSYVLGLLPTWWSNVANEPAGTLRLSKEGWISKLGASEFGNIEAVTLDADEPHQLTVTMVLDKEGYQVVKCKLGDIPPAGQDVISLLDVENPIFHDIKEAHFLLFKTFLLGLQDRDAGMLWVTHLIDIGCKDPRYAQILGLSRTIRTEQLADLATCQVDSFESNNSINQLLQVLAKFQARNGDEELNPDFEWAIFNERVQVARYHPFVLTDELLVAEGANEMATLNVRTPGRVNSLHYARHERKVLESDEVEIRVYSAGLNFRDVSVALGIVELPVRLFGIEAAGIVTRVGTDVSPNDLQIGDRVVFFCRKDAFSTYTTTLAAVCVRIPDSLSFNQAGTMLIPYFTAIHSMINVGRVSKGQVGSTKTRVYWRHNQRKITD